MQYQPATRFTTRRGRRGSAIVLVLFMLIFMVIMGLVYLTSSRNERNSGRASAARDSSDDAVQASILAIANPISDDYVYNFLNTTNPTPYYQYITYPNVAHPWLAPVDGFQSSTGDATMNYFANSNGYIANSYTGAFDTWQQVSLLYPNEACVGAPPVPNSAAYSPFTTINNSGPIAPNVPRRNLQMPLITAANFASDLASAEAAGWTQTKPGTDPTLLNARYQLLHIPSADGTVWLIAVHTEDNSALINVNTATQVTNINRTNGDPLTARNPTAVDLFGFLTRFGSTGGNNYITPANLSTNWNAAPAAGFAGGFIQARGFSNGAYVDTTHGYSSVVPFGRDQMWSVIGNTTSLDTTYSKGGGPNNGFYAFGPADEAMLRSGSASANTRSTLQGALNGNVLANVLMNASPRLGGVALRRYLTTYNASSLRYIGVNAAGNKIYRTPMMPYLDNLDGQFGPAAGPSATNPIPYYKLNPNAPGDPFNPGDNPNDILNLFCAILTRPCWDSTLPPNNPSFLAGYEGSATAGLQAAYSLDANLKLYTDNTGDYSDITNFVTKPVAALDPGLPVGTDATELYYPISIQPFITEALSIRVEGDPSAATPIPPHMALVIELRNPFLQDFRHNTNINLANYSLAIDGVLYPLKGTLNGIDPTSASNSTGGLDTNVMYFYSDDDAGDGHGDDDVQTFLKSPSGVKLTPAQFTNQTGVLHGLSTDKLVGKPQKIELVFSHNAIPQPPNPAPATNIDVVVDRLGAPPDIIPLAPAPQTPIKQWPAQPADPDPMVPGSPAPGTITSSDLTRDCGYHCYVGSAIPTAAMPDYVFENAVSRSANKHPYPDYGTAGSVSAPYVYTDANVTNYLAYTAPASIGTFQHFIPSWKKATFINAPEFRIPLYNGGRMDSIGEIASLLTVSHTVTGAVAGSSSPQKYDPALVYTPVSEYLASRLTDMAGNPNQFQFARLRTNEFCCVAGDPTTPQLPLGCLLLDALDLLPINNTHPLISGKINIETAPANTFRALPFLSDPNLAGNNLAGSLADGFNYSVPIGLQAYRDRLIDPATPTGGPTSPPFYNYSPNTPVLPWPPTAAYSRLPFTGIANLRNVASLDPTTNSDLGFAATTEVLCARNGDTSILPNNGVSNDPITNTIQTKIAALGINIAARNCDPANIYYPGEKNNAPTNITNGLNSGPLDQAYLGYTISGNYGSAVLGDTMKYNALFNLMSNSIDVRGDVFTSYVKLVGVRQVNGVWTTVATRHFCIVFDRTNVVNAGDTPKILMFVEW